MTDKTFFEQARKFFSSPEGQKLVYEAYWSHRAPLDRQAERERIDFMENYQAECDEKVQTN